MKNYEPYVSLIISMFWSDFCFMSHFNAPKISQWCHSQRFRHFFYAHRRHIRSWTWDRSQIPATRSSLAPWFDSLISKNWLKNWDENWMTWMWHDQFKNHDHSPNSYPNIWAYLGYIHVTTLSPSLGFPRWTFLHFAPSFCIENDPKIGRKLGEIRPPNLRETLNLRDLSDGIHINIIHIWNSRIDFVCATNPNPSTNRAPKIIHNALQPLQPLQPQVQARPRRCQQHHPGRARSKTTNTIWQWPNKKISKTIFHILHPQNKTWKFFGFWDILRHSESLSSHQWAKNCSPCGQLPWEATSWPLTLMPWLPRSAPSPRAYFDETLASDQKSEKQRS